MNISKIAKLAGVSPATVSRYLNDGYVSAEKKEKIKEVIDQTGYVPLASAQNLRTRKNNLIGVIVPKISSESISRVIDGINEALKNTKYNILLASTSNDIEKELDFLSIFKNSTVDGVILVGTIFTRRHHNILKEYEKPFVIIGQNESRYSCIYHDDFTAGYKCGEYLIQNGCRKIGAIFADQKDKSAGQERKNGFLKAMSENKVIFDEKLSAESLFKMEDGAAAMEKILAAGTPDGLFCATDTISTGARQVLNAYNIQLNRDIKLVGIGDSRMSQFIIPPLSSVHLHYKTSGIEATEVLLDKLANNNDSRCSLELSVKLVER